MPLIDRSDKESSMIYALKRAVSKRFSVKLLCVNY